MLLLYALAPSKARWAILLVASYIFYMCWRPEFALLILGSTVVDFLVAKALHASDSNPIRAALLFISLTVNLGLLFIFKYLGFAVESLKHTLIAVGLEYQLPLWSFVLPVGISFYTFQTLSYTLDVYNRRIEPERHFGKFALFVSYFPQLVAGPIERSDRLFPQLNKLQCIRPENIGPGLDKITWGFFKKLVVADRVAICVDAVYNSPTEQTGATLVFATLLFAFQIYCDFSGYSDIAIGCSKILGIDLMENFRRPYFATSIGEFWQRWHISLSTWFRDYLYIPLGGNRVSFARGIFNVLLVFVVSGVWHGANWTFVAWGLVHGLGLIVSRGIRYSPSTLVEKSACRAFTFSFVCIAWIFFRANSLQDALVIIYRIGTAFGSIRFAINGGIFQLIHAVLAILALIAIESIIELRGEPKPQEKFWIARPLRHALLIASIALFGVFDGSQFIYFQF